MPERDELLRLAMRLLLAVLAGIAGTAALFGAVYAIRTVLVFLMDVFGMPFALIAYCTIVLSVFAFFWLPKRWWRAIANRENG